MSEWRTGRKVFRTIYQDDELLGVMDTAELAEKVVRAVNLVHNTAGDFVTANEELGAEVVRLRAAIVDLQTRVAEGEQPRVYRYSPEMWASWCPCGRGETGWGEHGIRDSLEEHQAKCQVIGLRAEIQALKVTNG